MNDRLKLIWIEIHNIRGIPNLTVRPEGNNFVVSGPNGSGKSALVDAIDFLLSGSVTRLTGEGTGDIHLREYGKHIKSSSDDVWVRAEVDIPNYGLVIIERHIRKPLTLICSNKGANQYLKEIENYAKLGQHIITRREIIRFVLSKPSSRAEMMSNLLDLMMIEKYRERLLTAKNKLKKELEKKSGIVSSAMDLILATTEESDFNKTRLLEIINEQRKILGGSNIIDIDSNILQDIESPVSQTIDRPFEMEEVHDTINKISILISPQTLERIRHKGEMLLSSVKQAHSINDFKRSIEIKNIVDSGILLIDSDGSCPLCDNEWAPGSLKKYLLKKQGDLEEIKSIDDRIFQQQVGIFGEVDNLTSQLEKLALIADFTGLTSKKNEILCWIDNLKSLEVSVRSPFGRDSITGLNIEKLEKLFLSEREEEILQQLRSVISEKLIEPKKLENAYALLIQLQENLEYLVGSRNEELRCAKSAEIGEKILDALEKAMKNQLEKLYEEICDRFSELYRELHGPDEQDFEARFARDGPALKMETDFYKQGQHPPAALHSEGHQDSMGFALHLAIREHLTHGSLNLLVLDDIMMSIDSSHRKQVCKLLRTLSSDTQFIITTHDKAWAHHLRSEGVVTKKGMMEFYGWNLDTGPRVYSGVDIWDKIQLDLEKEDVVAAAGRLRNGLEQFFEDICDALEGSVRYRSSGLYDLGDFLSAAVGQTRKLLGQAKATETASGNTKNADSASELAELIGEAYTKTNAEGWVINRSLHYNNWANISSSELSIVVDTFRVLSDLFVCEDCESRLTLMKSNNKPIFLRCSCGKLNWNL